MSSPYILTPVDFDPFADGKEIDKIVNTNEPQKEIWLSCIIGEDESNLAYNESVSLELKGPLHTGYFLQAVQEVVARHESLRATVSANGESLIIYKNYPFEVSTLDISAEQDQKAVLDQFVKAEMEHLFDLQEGPLFRVFLHKLNERCHFFTMVKHHIIGDGWSTGVILEDLSKIYNAKVKGTISALGQAPQISQYALEMEAFKNSAAYQQTAQYWLDMYQDKVPVLDLPTDFPRPARRTYKANRIDQTLPPALVEQLKKTGAKSGCSLVNTLLSAFEIFLYLQTNQQDIVVGLPAAGQAATEHFGLVGHCVNVLPLKTTVNIDTTFAAYLKKRKSAFFDAYDNQKFTFGQLVKKLNIKRDPSRIPLVPVLFNIDMGMDNSVAFDHLTYKLISNPRAYETFEIFLNATGSKSSFILEWSYNTQLFKAETINQLSASFAYLLQTLATNPDIALKELVVEPENNWKAKLDLWNDTTLAYPQNSTLTQLITLAAKKYPHKTAVHFQKESISYTELEERSNQLAACLISKGIKTGDLIGLAIERSANLVVCLLGILKSGAAYIPLDPAYPQDRIAYMLEDAKAKMLIVAAKDQNRFHSHATVLIIEQIWQELAAYPNTAAQTQTTGADLAYVLYTSGSTGNPKGVQIKHHNLNNFLLSMQHAPGMAAEDRLLAVTTISFDIAGLELYLPLISGAEIVLCDQETARDGRLLLDLIAEKNITVMQATPSTWGMMIAAGWNKKYPIKVLCGGEALSTELAANLLSRCAQLWNMYGPTETTIWSTIKQITNTDTPITIGRPIHNTQIYILDDANKLVKPGDTGELFIGGEGVAPGYLNRPELTAERFIDHPFPSKQGEKLYKTGDLARFLDNGEIQHQGRIDEQVKIRGYRIELGEIETLLNQQQGIKQAVVLAREDHPGDKRLIAYVTLADEEINLLTDTWKNALRQQLPEYMVPAELVTLKAFPLTPNNKIDKKAFPKPLPRISSSNKADLVPKDQYEATVSRIWSAVLGIEQIGLHDDFFELGGHSLLAVKVMTAIEKETGKRLPLATLFEHSTIFSLAQKLHSNEEEKWQALVEIKTTGSKDPIFVIHGAGLNVLLFQYMSKHLHPEQPVYGLQALGLYENLDQQYTFEEISAIYISEIIKVNPNGPYCLAGYSLGGFFAFEISRQLVAMGKTVKFTGILDTYAGDTSVEDSANAKRIKKILRQFKKIPFYIKSFINNPKEALDYQVMIIKSRLNGFVSDPDDYEEEGFTENDKEIYKKYDFAHNNYMLQPSDFKISLFNSKKKIYFLDDQKYLGWKKLGKKGIQVYPVPGDHRTFLRPPNDQEFAKIFQQVLDKA